MSDAATEKRMRERNSQIKMPPVIPMELQGHFYNRTLAPELHKLRVYQVTSERQMEAEKSAQKPDESAGLEHRTG